MESLFRIGLIAAESALGQLVGCLQTPEADAVAEAALLDKVQWLLCRPEEPDALSLLAQADAVILAAIIRGERDLMAVASTLRTLQRTGRKILAVTLWGPQAHGLATRIPWPGILLPDSNHLDLPPGDALRACVYEAIRQAGSEASFRTNLSASSATTTDRVASSSPFAKPVEPASRNIGGRQVRDLSHLRQRGNAAGRAAAAAVAAEARTEEISLQTVSSSAPSDDAEQAGEAQALQPESYDAHRAKPASVPDWQETVIEQAIEAEAEAESLTESDSQLQAEVESIAVAEPLNPSRGGEDAQQIEPLLSEIMTRKADSEPENQQLAERLNAAAEQNRQPETEEESLKASLFRVEEKQGEPAAESDGHSVVTQARLAQVEAELQAAQQEVKSLLEQVLAGEERAQFAESKTEDFFQRFARERRRAADLSRQATEAGERLAHLTSVVEGHQTATTQLRVHLSKLERVRDMLIGERERALKERDEARSQVGRLDAGLKTVNGDNLSSATQLRERLQKLEQLRDELVRERDHSLAERDAVQSQAMELERGIQRVSEIEAISARLQSQLQALESVNEEIGADRDRVLAELEHERSLYGQLEAENQSLTQANGNLLNSLQSATSRQVELEALRSSDSGTELPTARHSRSSLRAMTVPQIMAEEFSAMEFRAAEDLAVIRRIEAVIQRLPGEQKDLVVGAQAVQTNGSPTSGGVSYEWLLNITHDLHQAIAAITDLIERLLATNGLTVTQQQAMLSVIRRQASEMLHTVGAILDFSRLRRETIAPVADSVDLAEIASHLKVVTLALIGERELDLEFNIWPEAQRLETDGAMLRQMLSHLLVNTVRFTPSGSISVEARAIGSQVVIAVTGADIEMDSEELSSLIEDADPGDQKSGVGLGLPVALQMAERLGGTIKVEPHPSHGAIFKVIIPRRLSDGEMNLISRSFTRNMNETAVRPEANDLDSHEVIPMPEDLVEAQPTFDLQ